MKRQIKHRKITTFKERVFKTALRGYQHYLSKGGCVDFDTWCGYFQTHMLEYLASRFQTLSWEVRDDCSQ